MASLKGNLPKIHLKHRIENLKLAPSTAKAKYSFATPRSIDKANNKRRTSGRQNQISSKSPSEPSGGLSAYVQAYPATQETRTQK